MGYLFCLTGGSRYDQDLGTEPVSTSKNKLRKAEKTNVHTSADGSTCLNLNIGNSGVMHWLAAPILPNFESQIKLF
jgi:hypothetical protein